MLGPGKAASGVCCYTSYCSGQLELDPEQKPAMWRSYRARRFTPVGHCLRAGRGSVNSLILPTPSQGQVSGLGNSLFTEMADGSQAGLVPRNGEGLHRDKMGASPRHSLISVGGTAEVSTLPSSPSLPTSRPLTKGPRAPWFSVTAPRPPPPHSALLCLGEHGRGQWSLLAAGPPRPPPRHHVRLPQRDFSPVCREGSPSPNLCPLVF